MLSIGSAMYDCIAPKNLGYVCMDIKFFYEGKRHQIFCPRLPSGFVSYETENKA